MPAKAHRQSSTENAGPHSRAQSVKMASAKGAALAWKGTSGGGPRGSRSRPSYVEPKANAEAASAVTDDISDTFEFPRRVKLITEVTDKNIDEVLDLPDLSLMPQSFLTEIEQDEAYATILEELRKKRSTIRAPKTYSTPENEQHKPMTSYFTASSDDDNISAIDELSTATANEAQLNQSNDGYDTDIEIESGEKDSFKKTDKERYRESCEEAKLVPCSYFMAHIEKDEIVLRYHQFNTEDIKAITKTLTTNYSVERLFLDGNYLQQEAAKYIARLIVVNEFITELSLVDNRLGGGEGTKELCKMLTLNQNLRKINLSGNMFNEVDVTQLIEAFERNTSLRELDISHNCFGEKCGKVLGAFISGNDSLEVIDLSWNSFRGQSAIAMINGVKENTRLRRCNLEMNGFGPSGGPALAECIKKNTVLEEFNIGGNRLNTQNAFTIAQALLVNDTLQVLKIADNQINSDGVLAVFLCIKANETNRLREIDFSHTVITQETVDVCEDIVKLKDGKFVYRVGKVTPKLLQSNANSECYIKTNETLLKKLRTNAAKVKPNES